MSNSKNKIIRYKNLVKFVINWRSYLIRKIIGFKKSFVFNIKNFGEIEIDRKMFGPFRENFFDKIYFRHIPKSKLINIENPVIIDIGVNVGFFSLAAFSDYPGATLYSFEPHPYCFEVLEDYKKSFNQFDWHIYRAAVSDSTEDFQMYSSTDSGFTTMSSIFQNKNKQTLITAQSIKLDDFISENKIECIDFIKIDCEGSEYMIIYNLDKSVFDKIDNMCIETHKGSEATHNANSLNNFLQEIGYTTKFHAESDRIGYIWAWKE